MFMSLGIFFDILTISNAVDGVLWYKNNKTFVPLFSISSFRLMKNFYVNKTYDFELHNFHRESLTLAYSEEENMVSFFDNNTKITGIFGEVWTILADYLNFTLIPMRLEDRNFGTKLKNGSYDGLLGILQKNQSQIIPRSAVLIDRSSLLEYTIPLWKIRYHLYIIPEYTHDQMWMFHLFSTDVWYAFLSLLFILSIAGYICEKYSVDSSKEKYLFNLQDYMLYSVALASSQGCVPIGVYKKSRIIYICTSIFSWVTLIAFNSHAIYLMMNKKHALPFYGLRGLIQESKYDIVAFNGSMVHEAFEDMVSKYYRNSYDVARVSYVTSVTKLYDKVCFSKNRKLAAFEAEDRHKARGKYICSLLSTKTSYFETWIASAVKRGYRYKRSFDIGILKIYESGLLNGLKDRWLEWKYEERQEIPFQSIDMSQVYMIFGILFSGFIVSVIILMLEYLTLINNKIFKNKHK